MGRPLGWVLVSPPGAGRRTLVRGDLRSRDYQHKTDYRREGESLAEQERPYRSAMAGVRWFASAARPSPIWSLRLARPGDDHADALTPAGRREYRTASDFDKTLLDLIFEQRDTLG